MGRREALAGALARVGALRPLGALRSAVTSELRVLAYHRVLDAVDEVGHRGDVELISARVPEFDWQMAYVASRCSPVSCRQVLDALEGGPALPRRPVLVTFDDGFADNHEVAWPVLRRHGVPAIFFVSTDYIDGGQPYWFDWLVDAALRLRGRDIDLPELGLGLAATADPMARRRDVLRVLSAIKRVPDAQRLEVLRRVRGYLADEAEGEGPAGRPMTWAQLRELTAQGMEVGSHTASHPVLARLASADRLAHELTHSRQRILQETGVETRALAYPVGGRDAVSEAVVEAVAEAGYRVAFTYQSGVDRLPLAAPFGLRRLHVERYTSRDMFRATMELPGVFAR